jgi:hypothetical protein
MDRGRVLTSAFSVKLAAIVALLALATAPFASARAQSPASIAGRTIQLTISSGEPPFAGSGSYRFLPSATDDTYAIVPISGAVVASSGTYSYAKTGPTTAQLSLTDSGVGVLTADCTFTIPSSGTYVLVSGASPGVSQSGAFFVYSAASPPLITGQTITVTITSGFAPFATSGAYLFLPASSGNTYNVFGISGVVSSSGTYLYSRNSPKTGSITYDDSVVGLGFSAQLSFLTATDGTMLLKKSGSAGYQTGVFTLVPRGIVTVWGYSAYDIASVPVAALQDVTAVAAGDWHTLALRADGTVIAWGRNSQGQTTVPSGLNGVKGIAAGAEHSIALTSEGTIAAWGFNFFGQATIPVGLSDVKAIAAGNKHTVALKNDGSVVTWGYSGYGLMNVPVTAQSNVKAVAAGLDHTVALRDDGTVIAWGWDGYGQTDVPDGLEGVIGIAAGGGHTVALKGDGTVVAWGYNAYGQTNVPDGLNGVASIAAGGLHTVALKGDGSVVAWGYNSHGQVSTPVVAQRSVTAITAGSYHSVALIGAGDHLPAISAMREDNNLTIFWPETVFAFGLQSTVSLSPPVNWNTHNSENQTNGGLVRVTLPINGGQQFFRIIKP